MKPSQKVGLITTSAIRRILERSAKMEDVIHLEQGEPNFATPEHIMAAAKDAMMKGCTHYTEISGSMELRQAISIKLEKDNDIEADPNTDITVTSGSQEAMFNAALGFLDPGDEALILEPYYPAYFEDTLLAGAIPISVSLSSKDNYRVDLDQMERKVTRKTKMIWMCNPSNPTGHVFSKQDLEVVAEVAKKHDLIVFADEIYEKITYDGIKPVSLASIPGMQERTITVNGFSKAYAMTGWRIGYMVADKDLSAALRTLHYYSTLCASTLAQKAALAALTGPQDCVWKMVEEYSRRRETAVYELAKLKAVSCPTPKGAFYVFPDFSRIERSDEQLAERILENAKVATVPGSGFGMAGEGHLRISYSSDHGEVKKGMARLRSYLESENRLT